MGITRRVPLLVAALLAFTAGAGAEQTPQFRAGTDVVAIDFYAVDKDGRPVLGLRPDELTVTINKAPRPIRSLEFVRVAPGEDVDTPMPAASRAPAAFGSNTPADAGRLVFFVFDHEGMAPGDENLVKTSIGPFLDQLSPRDRVGLVTIPRGRVIVDLTTDRARLLTGLRDVSGHFSPAAPAARGCGSGEGREANDALVAFLDGIAHLDGPKVVVFVSPGLIPGGTDCNWEYENAAKAAAAARVHLYGIVPHHFGSSASFGSGIGDDGFGSVAASTGGGELESLVGVTGGELFQPSGSVANIFTRIARESSAYYLLSVDTTAADKDGKSHPIALTTTRPGVTIRARPSFSATPSKDDVKRANDLRAGGVKAMLGDLSTHPDLPVRVAGYAFRDAGKRVRVLAAADAPGGGAIATLAFGLYDASGKTTAEWPAPPATAGVPTIVASATVPAGAYRLRAAAVDATDHLGAADYEFTAALTRAGPFDLSDLMLGTTRGTDFAPRLAFSTESAVTAYFELYGAVPTTSARPPITIEIADHLTSAPRASAPAVLAPTKDLDRWIVTATMPIASLPPGDYVVRAIVHAPGGGELGRVVRTLHKDGKDGR